MSDPILTTATPWIAKISWGAVLAGTCVAIAVMVLCAELCGAMGWSLVRPLDPTTVDSAKTIATVGAAAWVVSCIIALFLGGWTAAHLARQSHITDSTLHGVLVWAFVSVLIILVAATGVGSIIGGAVSLTGSALSGAGSAVGGVAHGAGDAAGSVAKEAGPTFHWDDIRYQAQSLLSGPATDHAQPDVTAATPAAAAPGAPSASSTSNAADQAKPTGAAAGDPMALVSQLFGSANGTLSAGDRDTLASMLVNHGHLTQDQANVQINQWQSMAQEASVKYQAEKDAAMQKAKEAADALAKTLSLASFIAFIATALGLTAAAIGGHVGGCTTVTHRRDDTLGVHGTVGRQGMTAPV